MDKGKVLLTGSSGLVGTALSELLKAQGYQVGRLLRRDQADQPYWDIKQQYLALKDFENPDVIIHLAGENIGDGRWTKDKKKKLRDSRILSTRLLVEHFKKVLPPPKLFICASAIGFYGNRDHEKLDENSAAGADFVSQLALDWEESSQGIKEAGTRLVNLRTGLVISKKGGALAKMLPAFKLGLGGKIGSGEQIMSWIDINDMIRAVLFIIENENLQGPINLVTPNPVTNQVFSQLLAKQLNRPCFFPLPEGLVKLLFAEMGKELLLSSTRVNPKKLLDAGFVFKYAKLENSFFQQFGGKSE
ncbi:TIGR01777 family protein [Psychromonas sp. MB-3u-54]|uniref:TIGR01777 family oxidoreductase n=1 Tax=Psychromonas sp. MB-3u-54 TaxID=2058319 RepID=UPI000C342D7F|nr:TIGR01777 family oxidoreductase [Psychromonas sp. MB-3u-54]PKH02397.1 TIGR01777 family protein [Psychromonas sp. MB-3u-54]